MLGYTSISNEEIKSHDFSRYFQYIHSIDTNMEQVERDIKEMQDRTKTAIYKGIQNQISEIYTELLKAQEEREDMRRRHVSMFSKEVEEIEARIEKLQKKFEEVEMKRAQFMHV